MTVIIIDCLLTPCLTVGDLSGVIKGASQKKKEREQREYANGS